MSPHQSLCGLVWQPGRLRFEIYKYQQMEASRMLINVAVAHEPNPQHSQQAAPLGQFTSPKARESKAVIHSLHSW